VSTVAQLHDLFWRHASSETVNLELLVSELCQGLQHTWPLHRLTFEAEPIAVPVAKAMPIALILNELATNAFKHAYGAANTGEVRVRLGRSAPGEIQLEVRDFGLGLPSGFDLAANSGSLGMKVIGALARQLRGRLDVRNAGPGASFILTVPESTAERAESREVEAAP
jgi:two-component sensor histidine kinase